MDIFKSTAIPVLQEVIGFAQARHEVLVSNVANINTPGYQTRVLDFASFLEQLQEGNADQNLISQIPVELMEGLQIRKDGNNVDLDGQLGELKKNALMFQTYSHLLASKMATVRRAMSG